MGFTHKTHGMKSHKLYAVYHNMIARCYADREWCINYPRYGGRGIEVCAPWRSNPAIFFEWALASGYKAGLYLDRVDNNGHYSPDNCRWITPTGSSRNRSGNALTLVDAAVIKDLVSCGVPQKLIGALYGVCIGTVSEIKLGHIWKDADPLTADFNQ